MKSETDLKARLSALVPGLEHSRETHVQWRDCNQKWRDLNPDIGTPEQHQKHIEMYDERIVTITDTLTHVADLERDRERLRWIAEEAKRGSHWSDPIAAADAALSHPTQ